MQIQTIVSTGRSSMWVVENYSPDYYESIKQIPLNEEPMIIVRGRECHQRRDVGFFSDTSTGYRYSGQMAAATPLTPYPLLKHILEVVNTSLHTNFNGILINRYKNGEKYISAHSDDEKGLDQTRSMVAAISYGPAVRTFRIRGKTTKQIIDYQHHPLTLVVMEGDFQKEFTHEIPIQKMVKEERISLTFRQHTY